MRSTKMELYLAVVCLVFYGRRFVPEDVRGVLGVSRSEAYRIIRVGLEEGYIKRVEPGVYTVKRVPDRAKAIVRFMFPFIEE